MGGHLFARLIKTLRNRDLVRSSLLFQRKHSSNTDSYLSALRPFYLAVHPDLFSQHPKEKAINEDSLKLLHSYLDDLGSRRYPTPVNLKFYLRPKAQTSPTLPIDGDGLYSVKIQLRSRDVSTSINQLLQLCSLPMHEKITRKENVYNRETADISMQERKTSWGATPRNFANQEFNFSVDMDFSFEQEKPNQRRRNGDLPNWFLNNIATARARMQSSEPVIAENREIVQRMKETLGLKSFILQNPVYSQMTLNGALKQLESLFLNKWSISSALLQRKVLTVGNFNGVDHVGRLVFDITDVPSSWTEALSRMSDIDDLAEVLRVPEQRISELLNGIKISRDPSALEVFPIETYYRWVTKLLDNLKESKKNGEIMTGVYSGLKGQVTKPRMFASVSPEGDILIPCVTTMSILDKFLHKNSRVALDARRDYARSVRNELHIAAVCREQLGLQSLLKDRLITPEQMVIGCKRLLQCESDILKTHVSLLVTIMGSQGTEISVFLGNLKIVH